MIGRKDLKRKLQYVYSCDYIDSMSKEGIASDIIAEIDKASPFLTIPDNPTNGDMIKALFKPYQIFVYTDIVDVYLTEDDFNTGNWCQEYLAYWWNAPYKRGDERHPGKWIKITNKISKTETETHWECSECHNPDPRLGEAEFCSFCGAKMLKEGEKE